MKQLKNKWLLIGVIMLVVIMLNNQGKKEGCSDTSTWYCDGNKVMSSCQTNYLIQDCGMVNYYCYTIPGAYPLCVKCYSDSQCDNGKECKGYECKTITCTNGQTQVCTASNGCAGTQTCNNNDWSDCVKNDPNCGYIPPQCLGSCMANPCYSNYYDCRPLSGACSNSGYCCSGACSALPITKTCSELGGITCPTTQSCMGEIVQSSDSNACCLSAQCGSSSCIVGEQRDWVITTCPGTQICKNIGGINYWGSCVKDDANCGSSNCTTGDACTVVVNGVDCAGTKVCSSAGAQVSCTKTVSTCGAAVCSPECQFFEECKEQTDKTTKCQIAQWVFIVGGVMVFFMFFSMMK